MGNISNILSILDIKAIVQSAICLLIIKIKELKAEIKQLKAPQKIQQTPKQAQYPNRIKKASGIEMQAEKNKTRSYHSNSKKTDLR